MTGHLPSPGGSQILPMRNRLAGSEAVMAQVTSIGNVVPASERSKSSVRARIGDLLSIEERHEDVAPAIPAP